MDISVKNWSCWWKDSANFKWYVIELSVRKFRQHFILGYRRNVFRGHSTGWVIELSSTKADVHSATVPYVDRCYLLVNWWVLSEFVAIYWQGWELAGVGGPLVTHRTVNPVSEMAMVPLLHATAWRACSQLLRTLVHTALCLSCLRVQGTRSTWHRCPRSPLKRKATGPLGFKQRV